MITASESRKIAEAAAKVAEIKQSKWTFIDTIRYRFLLNRINYWRGKGEFDITCSGIRPNVCRKLESLGYKIKGCGAAGYHWVEISW